MIEVINPEEAIQAINSLRERLATQKEATALFDNSKDDSFIGILGSIVQSFDGKYLYPSIEEQAVHLPTLLIKSTKPSRFCASFSV